MSAGGAERGARCGIDNVEIRRIRRLLDETPAEQLAGLFSADELRDAGEGAGRVASLAARFAAKEACLKLFPREAALGDIAPRDFSVGRNGYGAPHLIATAHARQLLDRYRLADIALSLTHDGVTASAVAVAEPARTRAPLLGKFMYRFMPLRRRVVLDNLRRVFAGRVAEEEIVAMAQAFYAHIARFAFEFLYFPLLPAARRRAMVRVENEQAILSAAQTGKGVIVLTGHFGNWELATVAAIAHFPHYRGRFHILRKPLFPRWLDALVAGRFRRAGLQVVPPRGSLEAILDRLAAGEAVVFVLDQHAGARDGVLVDFLGHPAWTFRSLALVALTSGAAVVPMASWREPDGNFVLRFEEALAPIERGDPGDAIRANTRAYNAALEGLLLRHPEQWFWMHRRWKDERGAPAG